ncbi:protein WBSCR14 homolog [Stomoxys calcitrans]|uniref:protein WBSCR14 homolog n=1 Tax=Stomoxys calcitrans TaxID=35570 RepID=UPI0027E2E100|nr:protein WBSCR14 homolog [Stomoxys calcitrans]XP_059220882.1 protein WBSCR14 homolog [Stomoxys calcitrans]XP_059220883.1 protein WBSCR14 homolog [Stomoxys calcitrans]XP_059220884.1 protein WBSCR14 homolog [Stomoxys calcitrans]XP_059220885.1 protein WBSCR14 homolog [Stomoxys calcitrans]
MMLNMSNKFSNYQHIASSVAAASSSSLAMASSTLSPPNTVPNNFSQDSNSSINSNKAERESIHSGQFMVSTFEAEEAQDDLDDSEIKMLDPEDPSLSKADEPNTCMDVQLYVPRKVAQQNRYGNVESAGLVTSHLEIETSLTKLFKCMNLAYSQKLTSPKWNHFKGVRLRWKDKIRLNNVIWRCWHMQFILKRKTPVCQFASPLDVDIHSNPQSVVLEGKYWKRQLAVIKAEYRKWRRNFKSKATGCLMYDIKSELDFLEWSPLNDKSLMLSDDWTSDTLFSAINGPFPFPDSREIARGAGIADFIQPSLGPLQPNLDDIDLTFVELLQNSRLPPVPEENSDELIKNVDYGFSSLMGSEQMDSSNMMDISASNVVGSMPNVSEDANMMELNTPMNALHYSDLEQQFVARGSNNSVQLLPVANNRSNPTNLQEIEGGDAIMGNTNTNTNNLMLAQVNRSPEQRQQQIEPYDNTGTGTGRLGNAMGIIDNTSTISSSGNVMGRPNNSGSEFPVKKGRIAKSSQRPFRREPHNYDKAQPTLHQTSIYQQMLAEHHKMLSTNIQLQTSVYQQPNQQQQQQQHHQSSSNTYAQSPQQYPTNLLNTSTNFGTSSEGINSGGMVISGSDNSSSSSSRGAYGIINTPGGQMNADCQSGNNLLHSIKIEVPSSEVRSIYNVAQTSDGFVNSNQYKPYTGNFKKSSSTGSYINVRSTGPNGNQLFIQQQQERNASGNETAGTIHAHSLPPTLGLHLPAITNVIRTQPQTQPQQRSAQLSPSDMQKQQSGQRILPPQLNISKQNQQASAQGSLQNILSSQQHQQQQQLQITQSILTNNAVPKEIYRSNSLPLNVSLQKLDPRLNQQEGNFAMPKSHISKANKTRNRSNSIHQHMMQSSASTSTTSNAMVVGNSGLCGVTANSGYLNLNFNAQLQSATSDPMLNSTLAQLLTTNSRMSTLGKQQSVSTSAISTIQSNATQPSLQMQVTQQTNVQNKVSARAGPAQQQQHASPPSPTLAANSPSSVMQHQSQQQQHMHPHQAVHKSPKKSTSLPTPIAASMLSSPPTSKVLSFPLTANSQNTCSTNLSLSPESFHDQDSPLSPTHSLKYPRDSQRRAGHIHAEQKRRYNIKNGFDQLHDLIPQLQQNNAKLSKAAMLQKGAEHIKHLRNERNVLKERMDALRMERDALNNSLTHLHSILPANGAPVTRQGTEHVRQLYEQYVRTRTQDNWKFWILGLILEPLLSSYTTTVSSASLDELRRTAFLWVDQHCSLIDLRPAVSNKLKYLSMKTDILSDPPSTLREEVAKAVNNTGGQHPNLHGS